MRKLKIEKHGDDSLSIDHRSMDLLISIVIIIIIIIIIKIKLNLWLTAPKGATPVN